jgi:predicted MFS family arabinose efflux permease
MRGPRSAILIGGIATGASYLLLATTQDLWHWYAFSVLNATARTLMFFIPFMALISRWFDRQRGIAVSILGTGFSLGGFLVLPIMSFLVDTLGWRGALVASGFTVTVVFSSIALLVVRNAPEAEPSAVSLELSQHADVAGVTLGEALRSPLFWTLSLALMLFFFGMFGWLVHQVPFYEATGMSRQTAATVVSIAAGLSIITRLLVGLLADRILRFELAALVLAACLMAAMASLTVSTSPAAIAILLVFWVMGTAGGPMMEALLLTRAFGLAHFATILGAVAVVETAGQILSPTAAGAIYDATGSYDWAIVMFLCTFGGAFALFLVALRLPRPIDAHPQRAVAPTVGE